MRNTRSNLERAYDMAARGAAGIPEFYRQLRKSTVWFPVAVAPEAGEKLVVTRKTQVPLQPWEEIGEGTRLPIWTSGERARSAMAEAGDVRSRLAWVRGEDYFVLAASTGLPVMINPASKGTMLRLEPETVMGLATGTILEPVAPRAGVYGRIRHVAVEDWPASFLGPLFEFLQSRPEALGAWYCRQTDAPDPRIVSHAFALWVAGTPGEAKRLELDFTMVAREVCPPGEEFGVMMLNPQEPATLAFMRSGVPFHKAGGLAGDCGEKRS